MPHTYKYARPALTVDCVIFGLDDDDLKVLLIQRDHDPFAGQWAIPGGFVDVGEAPEAAAKRELAEETGLKRIFLEQLYTFGEPDRDPREHVVTIAYYALVNIFHHKVQAATDARDAAWFPMSDLPPLAFDHAKILATAHERLRGKVQYQPIGFELLPRAFTLSRLQHLYEAILGREIDKRNFRKKILSFGFLEETGQVEKGVPHRAAKLYRFNESTYKKLVKESGVLLLI